MEDKLVRKNVTIRIFVVATDELRINLEKRQRDESRLIIKIFVEEIDETKKNLEGTVAESR